MLPGGKPKGTPGGEALARLFSGFTLHNYSALPAGGSLPGYFEPDLLLPGNGGMYLEPHIRAEAILDTDDAGCFPRLRRTRLEARVENAASPG